MALTWIAEQAARWDEDKKRIVGGAPPGIFHSRYAQLRVGETLPAQWWRVEEDGRTVGYGWMDVVWGDAEILLAVDPAVQGRGVGDFILKHLEEECRRGGLHSLTNMVRPTHPDAAGITTWLTKRGFQASEDGRLFRAVVKRPG